MILYDGELISLRRIFAALRYSSIVIYSHRESSSSLSISNVTVKITTVITITMLILNFHRVLITKNVLYRYICVLYFFGNFAHYIFL